MQFIVINPTYNEKENISIITKKLFKVKGLVERNGDSLLQLVVDDNSPDGTAKVVERLQKEYDFIRLIKGKKQGLGEAYKRGFKYAMKELNADAIVMMDADLQHEPEALPKLIKEFNKGYDFVIGSRYIKGGTYPKEWSKFRVINSKVANILAIYIAGIKGVKDTTSGYRVIRVKGYLDNIKLNNIKAIGYSFQLMLLYELLKLNAKVIEYPINFKERNAGKSKVGINTTYIRDILEFFKNAFKIRFGR